MKFNNKKLKILNKNNFACFKKNSNTFGVNFLKLFQKDRTI